MTTRPQRFLAALRALDTARHLVEELEDGTFGLQRREVLTAKASLKQARTRLTALAKAAHGFADSMDPEK